MRMVGGAAVAASALLAGCASVAPRPWTDNPSGSSLASLVVDRVVCEIRHAQDYPALQDQNYIAAAVLTLKAEDAGSITPALSFIHPRAVEGTSNTLGIGGELSQTRARRFTQSFIVDARTIQAAAGCENTRGAELTGDLRLSEIAHAGLHLLDGQAMGVTWADDEGKKLDHPEFAAMIEFVIKRSVNGGPAIVRKKFEGPGGASLLAVSRTDTDTLDIAFSPAAADLARGVTAEGAKEKAVKSARSLLNTQILRDINPRR